MPWILDRDDFPPFGEGVRVGTARRVEREDQAGWRDAIVWRGSRLGPLASGSPRRDRSGPASE